MTTGANVVVVVEVVPQPNQPLLAMPNSKIRRNRKRPNLNPTKKFRKPKHPRMTKSKKIESHVVLDDDDVDVDDAPPLQSRPTWMRKSPKNWNRIIPKTTMMKTMMTSETTMKVNWPVTMMKKPSSP